MHSTKSNLKGAIPTMGIVAIVLIACAISIFGYSYFSGEKFVARMCQGVNLDTCKDWTFESLADQQAGVQSLLNQGWKTPEQATLEAMQSSDVGSTQQTTVTTSAQHLAVKDFSAKIREPYSLSWITYDGNLSFYPYGADLNDPNTVAMDTVEISAGAGSKTSWNLFQTDTKYTMVLNGNGVYYDTKFDPFVFATSSYNKALGTYPFVAGEDVKDAESVWYDDIMIGPKIGTLTISIDNTTGGSVTYSGTDLTYNKTAGSGQFTFDLTIKNSGSNTLLRKLVMHPQNDQSNPLENNEYTAFTVQKKYGSDFNIPSSVLAYITNYKPISIGDMEGGDYTTVTFTVSLSNTNCADDEKLHMYFDDLGGYRASDVLMNNLGVSATDVTITCVD